MCKFSAQAATQSAVISTPVCALPNQLAHPRAAPYVAKTSGKDIRTGTHMLQRHQDIRQGHQDIRTGTYDGEGIPSELRMANQSIPKTKSCNPRTVHVIPNSDGTSVQPDILAWLHTSKCSGLHELTAGTAPNLEHLVNCFS